MTPRERVRKTIRFQTPDRLPFDFPDPHGSDFMWVFMSPNPDDRPRTGRDEWGAVWDNIGDTQFGEVKEYPLADWSDLDKLTVPDVKAPERWHHLSDIRERAGDRYVLAHGISLYERIHFLRGLENTWMDIYTSPEQLGGLIDTLVDLNIQAIERFSALGADGYIFPDDWGLQDRLMIAPRDWRAIWKPRYKRVFEAVHAAGMDAFLHSCGYIVEILDDLIEVGLDAIHMDQQENMGLETLGERFGGRLTFFSPVDIQNTMVNGTLEDIRSYCRHMVSTLARPRGGFIPRWYSDPKGAGHRQDAIDTMCQTFLELASAPHMWGRSSQTF